MELLRRRSLLLLLDGSAGSDPGVLVAPREAGGKVGEGLGKGGVQLRDNSQVTLSKVLGFYTPSSPSPILIVTLLQLISTLGWGIPPLRTSLVHYPWGI